MRFDYGEREQAAGRVECPICHKSMLGLKEDPLDHSRYALDRFCNCPGTLVLDEHTHTPADGERLFFEGEKDNLSMVSICEICGKKIKVAWVLT